MKKGPLMIVMLVLIVASAWYAYQGVSMHTQVVAEEANYHALQAEYFSQSKAVRDGAATDSEMSQDLVRLQQYPSELMQLKLVGVGKILTGIFIMLFAILMALMMMPVRLGRIIKGK